MTGTRRRTLYLACVQNRLAAQRSRVIPLPDETKNDCSLVYRLVIYTTVNKGGNNEHSLRIGRVGRSWI